MMASPDSASTIGAADLERSAVSCPLCGGGHVQLFHADKQRQYLRCQHCLLVFVPSCFYLNAEAEKAIYDLHENNPDDAGYRQFLQRIFQPVLQRLKPASKGLDFGCGPGPTLSVMFAGAGHDMALYDLFYAPDKTVLNAQYDFITATEVVEHLHQPGEVLDSVYALLKPGGVSGVMTKLVRDQQAFRTWHYKHDQTHVCFFSRETFMWLAQRWQADLEFVGNDVILLTKPESASG